MDSRCTNEYISDTMAYDLYCPLVCLLTFEISEAYKLSDFGLLTVVFGNIYFPCTYQLFFQIPLNGHGVSDYLSAIVVSV